jgi:hypothetical protein
MNMQKYIKMRKILVACSLFSVIAACEQKTSDISNTNSALKPSVATQIDQDAPVIKFEKSVHDFGTVTDGDTVKYNFAFTNVGKKDLIIANASASCGCTVPSFPKEAIKPGQNGEIKVVFNSTGRVGKVDKIVTVVANTQPDQTQVKIIGEVKSK